MFFSMKGVGHFTVSRELEDILNFLVERGLDINEKDKTGDTLLHRSAFLKPSIFKYLLGKGADVHEVGMNGRSVLEAVISSGREELVDLVLEKNPDVNAVNANGDSVLVFAIFGRLANVVKKLVDKGAIINDREYTYSLAFGAVDTLKYFLERLKRSEAEDRAGDVLKEYIRSKAKMKKSYVDLLMSYNAKSDKESNDVICKNKLWGNVEILFQSSPTFWLDCIFDLEDIPEHVDLELGVRTVRRFGASEVEAEKTRGVSYSDYLRLAKKDVESGLRAVGVSEKVIEKLILWKDESNTEQQETKLEKLRLEQKQAKDEL